jgi:hypothetical protein
MNKNISSCGDEESPRPNKPSRRKKRETIAPENAPVLYRPPDPPLHLNNICDIVGLTLVGAVAGGAIKLEVGGSQLISSNLHVAVATSGWAPLWYESMMNPIRKAQETLFRSYRPQTAGKAKSAQENLERQLDEYLDQTVYPDPEHVAYYEARIANRKSKLCRIVLMENPVPARIMPDFKHSPDDAMLTVFNGSAFCRNLFSGPAEYRELLVAGYDRKPFLGSRLDATSEEILVSPGLTLLAFGKAAGFVLKLQDSQWSDYCSRLITLCLEDISAESHNAMNLLAENAAAEWKSSIDRILELRLSGQQIVVKPEPAALEAMARFQTEIQSRIGTLTEHEQAFYFRLPELAWRLSLCQYILKDRSSTVLTVAPVQTGIALARWLAEHRFGLVKAMIKKEEEAYLQQQEDEMLLRVRLDGPVSVHDLGMMYGNEHRKCARSTLMRLVNKRKLIYSNKMVAVPKDLSSGDSKPHADENPSA